MSTNNKNYVELTDEQLNALKFLFPTIVVVSEDQVKKNNNKKKSSKPTDDDYDRRINAVWKKKYPFS
jgi:hypothetical protein